MFGALCHSKSFHEKVLARSFDEVSGFNCSTAFFSSLGDFSCLVSYLCQHFFFLTSKNVPCQMCFLINSNILFHVAFGQKIFSCFSPPFLLVYYIPSTIGDLDGVGLWSEVTPLNGQGGFQRIGF